jgi:hypothetical protein
MRDDNLAIEISLKPQLNSKELPEEVSKSIM